MPFLFRIPDLFAEESASRARVCAGRSEKTGMD